MPILTRFIQPMLISIALLISQTQMWPSDVKQQEPLPDAPSHQARSSLHGARTPKHEPQTDIGWPREADRGDQRITMYQPQLDSWEGDQLHAYAALSVVKNSSKENRYGVVWFTATTEVDKVNREVTLDKFQITKLELPTMKEKEAEYQAFLQAKLPGKSRVIALDRLETALEASDSAFADIKGFPVNNDPPPIIFTDKLGILVLIDGPPKFRDVGGTELQLVLNTHSTIIFDAKNTKYYLNVLDGWMQASNVQGPWSYASKIPEDMKEITKGVQERQAAGLEEGKSPPSLEKASKEGKLPQIFVSLGPAELLATDGPPQIETIPEVNLEYVKNTSANIFRDPATSDYYILLAGRWFKSKSLESGTWKFVEGQNLPEGFSKIPENSPKAGVLASVPGTGPAKEALIANSIPQTATITRSEARLEVQYDGEPEFKDITGTELQYAVNSATPVIRVADKNYFAVENAVWFVGPSPTGPWVVATSVPDEIYTIPPSAPLHYVTYVKVYSSTPDVVHVGYTPGYYGSVVSSTTTTVVYGTGWYYPPYVGHYWYGAPYTYGVGVATTWDSGSGWSLTIGVGYTYPYSYSAYPYPWYYYPWWGPWGYYGACCWGPAWGYGYGGYAAANVYGRWGNTAYANTRAAWANTYTGNYGAASRTGFQNTQRGTVGVAGRGYNTNVYTGNQFAWGGGLAYDPKTGIVAGGGAAYAGNFLTGQSGVGGGGFAYNTKTNAGVAVGNNNVYAGKDGTVYRYNRQDGSWAQNSGNGWQFTNKSEILNQQQGARALGQQRAQNFSGAAARGMRAGGVGRRR